MRSGRKWALVQMPGGISCVRLWPKGDFRFRPEADIDAACHARPHLVLDMGRLPEVGATLQWQSLGW